MKTIRNLSEANGMKVQITEKRFSLKKKLPKTTCYWLSSCENGQILKLLICNALSSTQYSLLMSSTSFAVLLSALPHCRIFSKSTGTRERSTCILDILQFRKTFFKRKKTELKPWNQSSQWTHYTTMQKAASESASFCNLRAKKISRWSMS